MSFYQRFISLCNRDDISPSRVALNIGLSKTAVNGWKKKGSTPTDATLAKLSEFFNVSIDYLLGITDDENGHKKSAPVVSNEGEISTIFQQLNDTNKAAALAALKALLDNQ